MTRLSHYKRTGAVQMVDVTPKAVTARTAVARAFVKMSRAVIRSVRRLETPKGNPLEVARIAGIAAAKRTSELIPLCHPLPLTHVDVSTRLRENGVELRSRDDRHGADPWLRAMRWASPTEGASTTVWTTPSPFCIAFTR